MTNTGADQIILEQVTLTPWFVMDTDGKQASKLSKHPSLTSLIALRTSSLEVLCV